MAEEFSYRTAAEDTWRIFRIMAEFVEAFETMSLVGPAVSVFGSARTPERNPYYQQARELGAKLSAAGFAVITGGGPGIMEAANRGADEAGGKSVGLNISLPHEQDPNPYQNIRLDFHYFFVRKVMFVKYATAFVIFPGGYGTMDEYFESMTLIQTEKIRPMKVVLIGSDFWTPLRDWITGTMLSHGNISPGDENLFTITDDNDEAIRLIREHAEAESAEPKSPEPGEELRVDPHQRTTAEGTVYGMRPRQARPKKGPWPHGE